MGSPGRSTCDLPHSQPGKVLTGLASGQPRLQASLAQAPGDPLGGPPASASSCNSRASGPQGDEGL